MVHVIVHEQIEQLVYYCCQAIFVNPEGLGESWQPPDFGMEGPWGSRGIHKILLYPIMYRIRNENTFQSGDFSKIERFLYIK